MDARFWLIVIRIAIGEVGLLSEEYDSNQRRQIGNFPQAFSHLALILTAENIEKNSARCEIAA